MFPEIARLVKQFAANRDRGELLQLDLKTSAFLDHSLQYLEDNGLTRYGNPGGSAWSGQTVTLETALAHSVVAACNRIVSEPIGYIPVSLMQQKGNDKQVAEDHPMQKVVHHAVNAEITSQVFFETGTSHCLLKGDAFAYIKRRSGRNPVAIGFEQILPEKVNVDREKTGRKRLLYKIANERGFADSQPYYVEPGKAQDIFHVRGLGWNGLRGHDVITMGRQSIGSSIAGEKHVASFLANGGRKPYYLERVQKFANEDMGKEWRARWKALYRDPSNNIVIEDGTKLHELGTTMVESQMNEFRQFMIPEVCRWFNVSPHLVGDLSRATFSNIEHLTLEFVKMTLAPWLKRWKDEFWRCVLTPEEQTQGYFLNQNLNALLRGDFSTRMAGYASALQNGHMNVDEVRDLEDKNPLPNGAGTAYRFQLNLQTTPGTGAPTITEQALLDGKVKSLNFEATEDPAAKAVAAAAAQRINDIRQQRTA